MLFVLVWFCSFGFGKFTVWSQRAPQQPNPSLSVVSLVFLLFFGFGGFSWGKQVDHKLKQAEWDGVGRSYTQASPYLPRGYFSQVASFCSKTQTLKLGR